MKKHWQIDAPQTTLASITPPVAILGTEPPPLPAESIEDEAPASPWIVGYTVPVATLTSTGLTFKQPEKTIKKHWLDKPILRDLFWFLVLPHRMKMFLAEQKERTEVKDEN